MILQIIVHSDHQFTGHIPETAKQGIVLAEILCEIDPFHERVFRCQLSDHFEGIVF